MKILKSLKIHLNFSIEILSIEMNQTSVVLSSEQETQEE
jgi:hypothetical protein